MQMIFQLSGKALALGALVSLSSCYYTGDIYTIPNPYDGINTRDPENNPLASIMQPITLDAPLLFEKGQSVVQLNITRGGSISYSRALTEKIGIKASAGAVSYRGKVDEHSRMYVHIDTYDNGILINQEDKWVSGQFEGNREQTQFYADMAAGWFKGSNRGFHHELYSGVGVGKQRTINDIFFAVGGSTSIVYAEEDRNFLHPFFQDNLSYRTEKTSLSWMNRASMIRFTKRSITQPLEQYTSDMVNPGWLYSTGLRFAAGSTLVRGYAQYELALPIGKRDVVWLKKQFSLGIILDLGRPD